jgi:hypothetical protein
VLIGVSCGVWCRGVVCGAGDFSDGVDGAAPRGWKSE